MLRWAGTLVGLDLLFGADRYIHSGGDVNAVVAGVGDAVGTEVGREVLARQVGVVVELGQDVGCRAGGEGGSIGGEGEAEAGVKVDRRAQISAAGDQVSQPDLGGSAVDEGE